MTSPAGFTPYPYVSPVLWDQARSDPPVQWPPLHVLGAELRARSLGDILLVQWLAVWCSCGWKGDAVTLPEGTPPGDVPREVIEEGARSWRFHVRLSNRVLRADRRLRAQSTTTEEKQ